MQPSQHFILVEFGRHLQQIHSISKFSLRQTLSHQFDQLQVPSRNRLLQGLSCRYRTVELEQTLRHFD
jgi:hypothetical protein